MKKPVKATICLLLLSLLLFLSLKDFSTNIRVDEAGGAYAFSPDKQRMAEICDGFCKDNGKNYAVIYLWDLKKYPSLLKERIHTKAGKKPEVKLVFPKDFDARSEDCNVKWTNSNAFEIDLDSANGLQILRYDVLKHTFTLTDANE